MNFSFQNETGNVTFDPPFTIPARPCFVHACRYSTVEKVALVASLAIVFLVVLAGNASLCYYIIKGRKHWTSCTWFSILNLAISDILIGVFCMPVLVVQIYTVEDWPFGETVCRVVPFVLNIAWIAAIMNLTIISIETFVAVCWPWQCTGRSTLVRAGAALAWIVAFIDAGYYTYAARKRVVTFLGKRYCIESWSVEENRDFLVTNIALFYFTPLMIILVLHTLTIVKLKADTSREERRDTGMASGDAQQRSETIRVLLLIALSFIVFMTPFEVYSLILLIKPQLLDQNTSFHLFAVTLLLFFFNLATHPLIYGLLSPRIRQALSQKLLAGKLGRGRSNPEQPDLSAGYQKCEQTVTLCEHEEEARG